MFRIDSERQLIESIGYSYRGKSGAKMAICLPNGKRHAKQSSIRLIERQSIIVHYRQMTIILFSASHPNLSYLIVLSSPIVCLASYCFAIVSCRFHLSYDFPSSFFTLSVPSHRIHRTAKLDADKQCALSSLKSN